MHLNWILYYFYHSSSIQHPERVQFFSHRNTTGTMMLIEFQYSFELDDFSCFSYGLHHHSLYDKRFHMNPLYFNFAITLFISSRVLYTFVYIKLHEMEIMIELPLWTFHFLLCKFFSYSPSPFLTHIFYIIIQQTIFLLSSFFRINAHKQERKKISVFCCCCYHTTVDAWLLKINWNLWLDCVLKLPSCI